MDAGVAGVHGGDVASSQQRLMDWPRCPPHEWNEWKAIGSLKRN